MPDLRADLLRVLTEHGLTADGGHPHSWRCSDKDRWPEPCSCPGDLVDDILALLGEEALEFMVVADQGDGEPMQYPDPDGKPYRDVQAAYRELNGWPPGTATSLAYRRVTTSPWQPLAILASPVVQDEQTPTPEEEPA